MGCWCSEHCVGTWRKVTSDAWCEMRDEYAVYWWTAENAHDPESDQVPLEAHEYGARTNMVVGDHSALYMCWVICLWYCKFESKF
jgi:hypothetical protein